ncbi:DNA replication and repair protein recF,recombination protein F,Recombinational DNA repair ATPase (RecF pathway),DNA replication and repair protein RecF,RecF/RecN/SMC N terminal domain [Chlamydia serpentis]|uniref:DNA replication and repair protein RecF n=1 Tax=Chlamydia serpentis TaxID=1967782 RepID=A0A2R8FAY3_9CHLA|nr:DNA replication/repair protein RecF [Chlamydia serpentis]SPN73482.1 DNA replication and repair protein recF,recombination protein F,Recombinational DNA repair ATPase (RecF pathway),DNA replication and repair protein RecF,RecF/RecN/SMC N terminal domain [Chlamydia serpentis]
MKICSLKLKNFRNHSDLEISLSPKLNYIVGKNAQGKTNLLEAFYVLSLGRSFRTQHLTDTITFGSPYFFLETQFKKDELPETLSIYTDKHGKKIIYNQAPIKTLSRLIGKLPIVLFSSQDRLLISGTPTDRRLFLNLLLSQCDSYYTHALSYYHRTLQQRNALLKSKQTQTLSAWNEELIKHGTYLSIQRFLCTQKLSALSKELWSNNLKEQLALKFKCSLIKNSNISEIIIAQEFRKQLSTSLSRDLESGSTSVGPHRDDFLLTINHMPVSQFSSEGQKHNLLVILRLAECLYLRQVHNISPLVCLDDIHAGLDSERVSQILDLTSNLGQTLITSNQVHQKLPKTSLILNIDNAQVSEKII